MGRALRLLGLTVGCLLLLGVGNVAFAAYDYYERDLLTYQSSDAKAQVFGQVRWYHGDPPRGYIHRGEYSRRAKVKAIKPVGCIWAKVSYGYPNGDFSVGPGGPAGSISGGSYDSTNGYFRSCRKRGRKRPKALKLYGIAYAKAFLNSTTLSLCTSRKKRDGPRYCSFEKNVYGGD